MAAADLMKMAMRAIANDPVMCQTGYMQLQIHDEIVCCVQKEHVDEYCRRLKGIMELNQPFMPFVPLTVDIGRGSTWAAAHK